MAGAPRSETRRPPRGHEKADWHPGIGDDLGRPGHPGDEFAAFTEASRFQEGRHGFKGPEVDAMTPGRLVFLEGSGGGEVDPDIGGVIDITLAATAELGKLAE